MPDMTAMQETISSDMPAWLSGVIRWLESRDCKILMVAMCFQVVILLGMIGLHSMPLFFGKTILIRVVPVDPRDLFRGDYVILSYAFSRTPTSEIEGLAHKKIANCKADPSTFPSCLSLMGNIGNATG